MGRVPLAGCGLVLDLGKATLGASIYMTSVPFTRQAHRETCQLPDLHGDNDPSTVSLLLDTVVGWRQLELISARSCALTLWILDAVAYAAYIRWRGSGSGTVGVAHRWRVGRRERGCAFKHSCPIYSHNEPTAVPMYKAVSRDGSRVGALRAYTHMPQAERERQSTVHSAPRTALDRTGLQTGRQ